ncbi:DNA alkylation repair protein [bacterium]|nr:DNA alkylation repair protein [bacterium]
MPRPSQDLQNVRRRLEALADAAHAQFHQAYHKSDRRFYGLRTPQLQGLFKELYPARQKLALEAVAPLVRELWASEWYEERTFALMLLERVAAQLTPADLPWMKQLTRDSEGWGLLDYLATRHLGVLALGHGEPVYREVRGWSADPWLWTRRASVLIHIQPARKQRLEDAWAWPTFEELLPDRDFFIRKAIGWTLRECSKHYPQQVHDFLLRVGPAASGLTIREGARNLPPDLRRDLLS